MTRLRHQAQAMVAEYLARGGTIRKMPEANPHTAADVIQYLRDQNVEVAALSEPCRRPRYSFRGEAISLERLVRIANRHRRRRNMPPFEIPIDQLH